MWYICRVKTIIVFDTDRAATVTAHLGGLFLCPFTNLLHIGGCLSLFGFCSSESNDDGFDRLGKWQPLLSLN